MTAARARAPRRLTLDPADDAALEAVVAQTIAALRRVGLVYDGTRSLTVAEWTAEIARVGQPIEDVELDAAAAVAGLREAS